MNYKHEPLFPKSMADEIAENINNKKKAERGEKELKKMKNNLVWHEKTRVKAKEKKLNPTSKKIILSEKDEERMVNDFRRGERIYKIAVYLNISVPTVKRLLEKLSNIKELKQERKSARKT